MQYPALMPFARVSWIVLGLWSEIVSSPCSAGGMEWEGCDSRAAAFTDSSFLRRREQLSLCLNKPGATHICSSRAVALIPSVVIYPSAQSFYK